MADCGGPGRGQHTGVLGQRRSRCLAAEQPWSHCPSGGLFVMRLLLVVSSQVSHGAPCETDEAGLGQPCRSDGESPYRRQSTRGQRLNCISLCSRSEARYMLCGPSLLLLRARPGWMISRQQMGFMWRERAPLGVRTYSSTQVVRTGVHHSCDTVWAAVVVVLLPCLCPPPNLLSYVCMLASAVSPHGGPTPGAP